MVKKRTKSLNVIINFSRSWLRDPVNTELLRDKSDNNIRGELAKRIEEVHWGRLAGSCDRMAQWLGYAAAVAILDGDAAGWQTFRRSFLYRSCHLRIATMWPEHFDWIRLIDGSLLLAHSIAACDDGFADWCGHWLLFDVSNQGNKDLSYWKIGSVPTFVLKLFAMWRKLDFKPRCYPHCDLGPYEQVVDAWDDESRVPLALQAACDYHAQTVLYPPDFPEFDSSPYELCPVEILAIRRVRLEQGLSMPEIEHPLMQTALAQMPDVPIPEIQDELLEGVFERIHEKSSER